MDGQASKVKVPQPKLHGNSLKRSSPSIFGQPKAKLPRTRGTGRTKEDFLEFCLTVLKYAEYHPDEDKMDMPSKEQQYNRASLNSDGLGSNSDSGGSNGTHGYDGSSTATAASSSEDDEAITCFCRKPFANRPMIECGSCQTWIHLSCAKIRRTHIPDVYICNKCRDVSQSARKSGRPRVETKKLVDDV